MVVSYASFTHKMCIAFINENKVISFNVLLICRNYTHVRFFKKKKKNCSNAAPPNFKLTSRRWRHFIQKSKSGIARCYATVLACWTSNFITKLKLSTQVKAQLRGPTRD